MKGYTTIGVREEEYEPIAALKAELERRYDLNLSFGVIMSWLAIGALTEMRLLEQGLAYGSLAEKIQAKTKKIQAKNLIKEVKRDG